MGGVVDDGSSEDPEVSSGQLARVACYVLENDLAALRLPPRAQTMRQFLDAARRHSGRNGLWWLLGVLSRA